MGKKIVVRIAAAVLIFYALIMIPLMFAAKREEHDKLQKTRMESLTVYAGFIVDGIGQKMDLNDINVEKLPDSEQADILEEGLLPRSIQGEDGSSILFDIDMVYDNGMQEAYILSSQTAEYKAELSDRYNTDVIEGLSRARNQQTAQTVITRAKEKQMGYLIIPAGRDELDIFYIAGVSMYGTLMENRFVWDDHTRMLTIYSTMLLFWLLLIICRMLRPIHRLVLAMESVSEGIYELPDIRFPDNELGDMWIGLNKMCMALRAQFLAKANVLNYYCRFAPKKFEQLFSKDHLQDISIGDTVSIPAAVGIVSVSQEENVLQSFSQGKHIRYINYLLDIVSEENNKKGGVLLSGDGKLESIKVIYRECADSLDAAVCFGINSIHALEAKKDNNNAIRPFVMLYNGQFICGLGGTTEQVCPFVNSVTFERLGMYTESLRSIGVNMVLMGENIEKLQGSYVMREIGTLSVGGSLEDLLVYEVLDACSKRERQGKQSTKEQFGQALALFYQNDFYLARNCFNEVLKEYAEDGVARWYLFLCEDMLNVSAPGNIRHDLFPRQEDRHGVRRPDMLWD